MNAEIDDINEYINTFFTLHSKVKTLLSYRATQQFLKEAWSMEVFP